MTVEKVIHITWNDQHIAAHWRLSLDTHIIPLPKR